MLLKTNKKILWINNSGRFYGCTGVRVQAQFRRQCTTAVTLRDWDQTSFGNRVDAAAAVLLSAPVLVCRGAQSTAQGTRVDCLNPAYTALIDVKGEPITNTRGEAEKGAEGGVVVSGWAGGGGQCMRYTAKNISFSLVFDIAWTRWQGRKDSGGKLAPCNPRNKGQRLSNKMTQI